MNGVCGYLGMEIQYGNNSVDKKMVVETSKGIGMGFVIVVVVLGVVVLAVIGAIQEGNRTGWQINGWQDTPAPKPKAPCPNCRCGSNSSVYQTGKSTGKSQTRTRNSRKGV